MGEGVRLKNEILSQNLIQQQSNQPQHPQQTVHTEKLLKETSTNNNCFFAWNLWRASNVLTI